MPPPNQEVRNKRPRVDNGNPGPSTIIRTETDSTPAWIATATAKTIRNVSNLQNSICKKQDSIDRLEQHIMANTIPASMQVKMAIMVSDEHQTTMNNIVAEAIKVCQVKILNELIVVRKNELQKLQSDMKSLEDKWVEEMATTTQQMIEGKLLDIPDIMVYLKPFHEQLKSKAEQSVLSVKTKHFLIKKEKIEKEYQRKETQAQTAMDTSLVDPTVKKLQDTVERLEKKIGTLSKKEKGKSDTPTKSGKSPNKGKQKPKRSNSKDPKSKKGEGSGKGNPKPKSRSNDSTPQSASKKRNSRKKQN